MKLRLSFDVTVGGSKEKRFGRLFMSDWSKKAAKKLRAQGERQAFENLTELHHQKLREEQGAALWREARDHVKTMCANLNLEYGEQVATFRVVQASELEVQLRAPNGKVHQLKAHFSPSSSNDALTWNTSGHRMSETRLGKCELHIEKDVVSFLTGACFYTPESLAEQMLDDLLSE